MVALLEHFEEEQDEKTRPMEVQLAKVVDLLKKISPETEFPGPVQSFTPDPKMLLDDAIPSSRRDAKEFQKSQK